MTTRFDWGPSLAEGPLYIGILNVTPDSFSDGGHFQTAEAAVAQARTLIASGARMVDVGAESTRPGALPVSQEAEWARLGPVLATLRHALPDLPLSLDTRHAETARRGLEAGVAVLNDVTGFSDSALLALAQSSTCGLIAMRSTRRGDGCHMPPYGGPAQADPVAELQALRQHLPFGPDRLLLDPGFGFGTTFADDQALWTGLRDLPRALDWPADRFCLGVSRKRFLAWRAGTPDLPPAQRDGLTREAHREALDLRFRIFRTHRI